MFYHRFDIHKPIPKPYPYSYKYKLPVSTFANFEKEFVEVILDFNYFKQLGSSEVLCKQINNEYNKNNRQRLVLQ